MNNYRNQAKEMRKSIVLFSHVHGLLLKPISNAALRAVRHRLPAGRCASNVRVPTVIQRNTFDHPDVLNVVRQLLGRTICTRPVSKAFVNQLTCLEVDTSAMAITLLKNTGATRNNAGNLTAVGTAFYFPFDRLHQLDENRNYRPMVLQPRHRLNVNLNNLNFQELSVICRRANQQGPVGILLLMYVMWDAYKRTIGGNQRYHGMILSVAHSENQSATAAAYNTAVRNGPTYDWYREMGFREIYGNYQNGHRFIEAGDNYPKVRMIFLWRWNNMEDYVAQHLGLNNHLKAVCDRSLKCL